MEIKVHGAWKIHGAQVFVKCGEIINTEPIIRNVMTVASNSDHVTLQTKGDVTLKNILTNEKLIMREGTFSTFDVPVPAGEYEFIFDEDIEFFCFSPVMHNNMDCFPLRKNMSPFRLFSGQFMTVEQGKKLFLIKGSISIENKNYTDVNRIKFSSGNKVVTSLTDAYGFFIND